MEIILYSILFIVIIVGLISIAYIYNYNLLQHSKTKINQAECLIDEALRYRYDIILRADKIVKKAINKNIAKDLEKLKDELNLPGMRVDLNWEMDGVIDRFVMKNVENEAISAALRAIEDSDEIIEYATLKSLTDKKTLNIVADRLESMAERNYNRILTANNVVKKDGKNIKSMRLEHI